ncbi:ATPdependent RNA helicase [Nowakowskiella sp. JEL0407]|nr:ATPdependent RNA helicase [Nowakowskiella sp. JEL0407]
MDMPAYAYWDPDFELKQRKKKGNGLRDSKDSKGKGKKTKKGKKMDDGFYCTLRLRTGMTQLLSEAVSEYHSAKRLLELDESSSSDSETEKKDSKKPFIVSKKSCIDDEEKPKEETEFSYPSDLLPSPASSEDESENEYAKWDYDPESVSSRDDDDSDRFCSLGKDDSDGEFVSDEEISESIKAIEEEEEWDATANDQINPPKVEPPHPTLTFLLSIGFPHRKIHQVMEVEDDPIEALVSLIDNEIGTADYSRNQQNLFQVTLSDADIIKKEEKEFLQEVFLSEFVAVDQDHWRVSKKIDVFDDKDLDVTTEIHFRKFSSYPFEAPVIFLSDQTSSEIPTKVRFELTLELNKRAQTSVGEPMIYNLVDWLGSDEAKSISQSIVGTNSISKKSNVLSSKNDNRELADISKKLAAMKISYLEVKDESLIPPEIAPVIAHIPNYIPVSHGTQTISQATSERMFKEFKAQQKSTEFQRMLSLRKQLPSWGKQVEIIDAVRNNRVVVISGETGCGKTTQVPQFILDNYIELQTGAKCKILVTQPRRISAIGVAQRVADERAEVLGKTVGYQIRLESRMSDSTRILFCTTGILLRRLEGRGADTDESAAAWGDGIDDISHIIVDEVHERSLDSDFLLMVLKDLLAIRTDLTLILMSATLNADLFCDYFSSVKPPRVHIEGRTFPVTPIFLEDALIQTHYVPEGDFITKKKKVNLRHDENPDDQLNDLAIADDLLLYENLRKRYAYLNEPVVRSLFTMDTEKIQYPLIAALVVNRVSKMLGKSLDEKPDKVPSATGKRGQKSFSRGRSYKGSKGVEWKDSKTSTNPVEEENRAILIFLPGYDDISNVHETLLSYPDLRAATADGLYCIPLHSSLSSEEQIRVFNRPPSGYVKIIIATNIAETSITVDDVVYVIDSGRLKEMSYDSSKGMSALTDTWVSRSSAMQRRGRAGRVAAGVCVHLFTRHRFENVLEEQQKPEIQRVPLEQLCLRIKVLPFLKGRIGDVCYFFEWGFRF